MVQEPSINVKKPEDYQYEAHQYGLRQVKHNMFIAGIISPQAGFDPPPAMSNLLEFD